MINQLAKIFEHPETKNQILVVIVLENKDGEEWYRTSVKMVVGNQIASIGYGWPTLDIAMEELDRFTEQQAIAHANSLLDLFDTKDFTPA